MTNNKSENVVPGEESYQQLPNEVEPAEDIAAISRGLEQSLEGRGQPAADFFRDFEAKNDL